VLWLSAAPAVAQEVLTLEGAIHEALAHNAALRSARAGAAEASEHVGEARAGWLPRLSFTETLAAG
jgi:outer membrane protein TolC